MIAADVARDRLKWLKTAFPIHGIGWQLFGPLIAVGVVAAAAAVWLWLRDPAEDFLTSDVQVWQLVLTTRASVAALLVFVVWWVRRKTSEPSTVPTQKASIWALCPDEIEHFGVLWPITTVHDGLKPTEFTVGQPTCPTDRTPLAMLIKVDEGTAKEDRVVVPMSKMWKSFDVTGMRFECSICGNEHDLRRFGYSATTAIEFVEDHAWGEFRMALAKAEADKLRSESGGG